LISKSQRRAGNMLESSAVVWVFMLLQLFL